jgi:hypothetical protein
MISVQFSDIVLAFRATKTSAENRQADKEKQTAGNEKPKSEPRPKPADKSNDKPDDE